LPSSKLIIHGQVVGICMLPDLTGQQKEKLVLTRSTTAQNNVIGNLPSIYIIRM
jgi:hypothetical protein